MNFKTLKNLAIIGTAALALSYGAAKAADSETVEVLMDIESGITATAGTTMDFGDWLVGVHASETPTLTMAVATGNVTAGGTTLSRLVKLTGAATTAGTVVVTLPSGANGVTLQMQRGAVSAFSAATEFTMTSVTYLNSDNALQTGTLALATPVPIDVTTGATGATVSFGGVITATATPATDGAHTATFNVSFAY